MNGGSWMKAARQHKCAQPRPARPCRRYVSRSCWASRTWEHPPPAGSGCSVWSCWCWRGRGGASPDLCTEKITRAGVAAARVTAYAQPHWSVPGNSGSGVARCVDFLPAHRDWHAFTGERGVLSVVSPRRLTRFCSCRRWCMIARFVGSVSQRGPSLLYRVSLMMKPQVVFVLGGPGAGKGTQCSKIVEVTRDGERKDNENYRLWCLGFSLLWQTRVI